MEKKQILGYSIYFKEIIKAQSFFEMIPKEFNTNFNGDNEIILLNIDKLERDDVVYTFCQKEKKVSVKLFEVMFIETLFVKN